MREPWRLTQRQKERLLDAGLDADVLELGIVARAAKGLESIPRIVNACVAAAGGWRWFHVARVLSEAAYDAGLADPLPPIRIYRVS